MMWLIAISSYYERIIIALLDLEATQNLSPTQTDRDGAWFLFISDDFNSIFFNPIGNGNPFIL